MYKLQRDNGLVHMEAKSWITTALLSLARSRLNLQSLVDEARSEKRTNARKTTKSTRNVQPVNRTITMFSA